jgi:chromo domain-containing protein 1
MAPSDMEYDTDAISVTSTVEANPDEYFTIKGIVSEGVGQYDDGTPVVKYLVEWESYPIEE